MFRHRILVHKTTKVLDKSISNYIMKIKSTKITKTALFEKSKNLQKSQNIAILAKIQNKNKVF